MSEDLIKRSDAIKAYNEAMSELVKWQMEEWQLGDFSECEFNTTDCKHIVRKIEAIPSADRPQGKWIFDPEILCSDIGVYSAGYRCSVCGKDYFKVEGMNYCPNRGARMKGADDE